MDDKCTHFGDLLIQRSHFPRPILLVDQQLPGSAAQAGRYRSASARIRHLQVLSGNDIEWVRCSKFEYRSLVLRVVVVVLCPPDPVSPVPDAYVQADRSALVGYEPEYSELGYLHH